MSSADYLSEEADGGAGGGGEPEMGSIHRIELLNWKCVPESGLSQR
jgi:hypothetical protein